MTLIESIEQASIAAGIRTFRFANIREAQSFMDSFNFVEFPIHILLPLTVNGVTNRDTGIRKAVLPLQGWVLTRIESDPNDYRTRKVEDIYIGPMRTLANKFLKRLLESSIIDPEVKTVSDSIKPEYMFLNQHAFGVSYTMNVPIKDNVC